MRQPLGPADVFAALLDGIIRKAGGAGNIGQLRLRLDRAVDDEALTRAWRRLGEEAWPLGGRVVHGLRGMKLCFAGPAPLRAELCDDIDATADAHLSEGTGRVLARLAVAERGVALTWHHALCDARAAAGLLASLPTLAAGKRLGERWWDPGYRGIPGLPATARERGQQAQQAMPLLKPHRLVPLWRPLERAAQKPSPANRALPFARHTTVIGGDELISFQARQRQATGRMAETPFLLACVAAALEACLGVSGDVLMPLTVDLRETNEHRLLANCHGYCFLRVPAGLASKDLALAAQHLKQAHRDWLAADGLVKLSSSMSWFSYLPERLTCAQLGNHQAGVWASCVVANAGASPLTGEWFGAQTLALDHAALIPANPGVGVLFHRDARGLVFDTLACGRVTNVLPPARLAAELRRQLLERSLA